MGSRMERGMSALRDHPVRMPARCAAAARCGRRRARRFLARAPRRYRSISSRGSCRSLGGTRTSLQPICASASAGAPGRRVAVERGAVVERFNQRDVVHEVGMVLHVRNRRQIERGKVPLARLGDVGRQHGQTLLVVEHARVVEGGRARPTHDGHAHLLVGRQHDAPARDPVQPMQRLEPADDVGRGEGRHVGAPWTAPRRLRAPTPGRTRGCSARRSWRLRRR